MTAPEMRWADSQDARAEPVDEPAHPTITDHERGAGAVAHSLEQLVRVHFARSFVHGLKPAQWHALRYFAVMPQEQRTVTAFARHRGSTMGTASTTISALVRKGYLGRRGSGARNSGLHVTEEGHELLSDDPINELVQAIDTLDPQERSALERALPKLVDYMTRGD
ncbi:MarR family winged helix-turn-helix transcriptional regulator [Rhodovibrio salinarum]|nr:MarR family winged helix-turn-helix transcriptional regulator [Rhodovibrio salinarum]